MPRTRTAAAVAALASFLLILCACSSGSSGSSKSSASPAPASSSSTSGGQATGKLAVAHPTVWLCRPGMANNPCEGNLDATDVGTGTGHTVQTFTPASDPKIDCFYVYPTASTAKTTNAPLAPEPAVIGTARAQVSRFASTCRVFAPVYRQLTITSITNGSYGNAQAQALAAGDVDSAWHDYLNTYNQGRGVVLIGHSQGAGELQRLIHSEIDDNPAERSKLVSAVLLGGNVLVPQGKDVGGVFANIPACRRTDQTGCVVAYSSFADAPPPNSLFGRAAGARNLVPGVKTDGMQVLCVNPVTLGAGTAALHPYLPTPHLGGSLNAAPPAGLPDIPTAFVTFSGLKAECVNSGGASYLHITGSGSPYLAEATTQALGPTWGLHLLDVSDAYGDLVSLVQKQAAVWK